jgi:fructosamine-3-kinase
MTARLASTLERALGQAVLSVTPVRGGDTAAAFRVGLANGGRVFAKTHSSPPPGFFTTEAAGLSWLRDPGCVAVPAVLAVSDGDGTAPAFLALEWIDEGRRSVRSDTALGRSLAALHDAGAECFGRTDRRTTGSLGLPNEPARSWSEFVATNRFVPLAAIARDRDALPPAVIDDLEALARRVERFDDGAPPARLHGDLWAGNRIVDATGVNWLIDPAAHGGHREFDLAMMRLFGGYSADCFAAYAEVAPLSDGWADRVSLHQIAPLVVHAIKFGGGYVTAAAHAIRRY